MKMGNILKRNVFAAARCFKRISRRAIDNYQPLAEYHMESLRACTDFCIMAEDNMRRRRPLCQSFTYDIPQKTCRLYDHDGMKAVPAILHPALGVDFYVRVADEEGCKGSALPENHLNFAKLKSAANEREINYENSRAPTAVEDDNEWLKDNDLINNAATFKSAGVKALQKKINGEQLTGSDEKKELLATCMTSTAYYVVIGNEIVFNDVGQGDCANFCSMNQGPHKRDLVCLSLNYFPVTRKCELYSILAEPHGPGSLVENRDVIYAEKFCLPDSSRSCQADEVFILHVQRSLSGIATSQAPAKSITMCLKACLDEDSCKTSVFDSSNQICHLYKESVANSQDSIVETPPGFVMIENGCGEGDGMSIGKRQETEIRTNAADAVSSEWSECTFRINGVRVQVCNVIFCVDDM
ncbi:unnamed protein product [Nippostrongylus brasiliensis]|uniref:PAN domain protein n=1 Tax=Nippostrongylus brasiliensis TaxID=27835 RepID=A0A0N4XTR1_NIPBR|nr:unnamed protein product [Nippostrongylus brasiliensis]